MPQVMGLSQRGLEMQQVVPWGAWQLVSSKQPVWLLVSSKQVKERSLALCWGCSKMGGLW